MRQLLSRVPDELHARLAAQAEREGRSVNALVLDLLTAGLEGVHLERRGRLRTKAALLGLAAPGGDLRPGEPLPDGGRHRDARGLSIGPTLDEDRDWQRYGDGDFPDSPSSA